MAIRWSLWRRRLIPPTVIISAIALFFGSLWFYYYSTYCWQHTDLLCVSTETVKSWLKIAASVTQIAGVFLLIKSIDQNINLLKGKTLISTLELSFQRWLTAWRVREFSAGGTSTFTFGGTGGVTVTSGDRSNMPLADRIKLLETAMDDVRDKHYELVGETRALATKVQKTEQEFIQRLEHETKSIKSLLSDISIGGLSNQIFGMYLIIYSATVSIFV